MSIGLPGNSVIVNLAMRFPVLIPVIAAVGIAVVVPQVVPKDAAPVITHSSVVTPPAVVITSPPPAPPAPELPSKKLKKG